MASDAAILPLSQIPVQQLNKAVLTCSLKRQFSTGICGRERGIKRICPRIMLRIRHKTPTASFPKWHRQRPLSKCGNCFNKLVILERREVQLAGT
jgi:hypothetical protein